MADDNSLQQALAQMQQIEQIYQPGGTFLKGAETTYEKGKKKSLAATAQGMVSRGLGGTSVAANVEKAYEEDIGAPWRLQIEDIRMQRLSEALQGKASVLTSIAQMEEQKAARVSEEAYRERSFTAQMEMMREQIASQEKQQLRGFQQQRNLQIHAANVAEQAAAEKARQTRRARFSAGQW